MFRLETMLGARGMVLGVEQDVKRMDVRRWGV